MCVCFVSYHHRYHHHHELMAAYPGLVGVGDDGRSHWQRAGSRGKLRPSFRSSSRSQPLTTVDCRPSRSSWGPLRRLTISRSSLGRALVGRWPLVPPVPSDLSLWPGHHFRVLDRPSSPLSATVHDKCAVLTPRLVSLGEYSIVWAVGYFHRSECHPSCRALPHTPARMWRAVALCIGMGDEGDHVLRA